MILAISCKLSFRCEFDSHWRDENPMPFLEHLSFECKQKRALDVICHCNLNIEMKLALYTIFHFVANFELPIKAHQNIEKACRDGQIGNFYQIFRLRTVLINFIIVLMIFRFCLQIVNCSMKLLECHLTSNAAIQFPQNQLKNPNLDWYI